MNNIPAKTCSYACRYCQVGPTTEQSVEPRPFFAPNRVLEDVAAHLRSVRAAGQDADHLTFVPDGEPTLDSRLGESIAALGSLGIPIAVISNSSLLWRDEVRARVSRADVVSVKVDSALEAPWRQVNRPHRDLRLEVVLAGIRDFARAYPGALISETMLVAGINDSEDSLVATAELLSAIAPRTAYLAVPIRPPAVASAHGPDEAGLVRAYRIFAQRLPSV